MKSGGFKSKGGGLRRKAPSSVPEGISRNRLGKIRVRDPEYMRLLHESGEPMLDLGAPVPSVGVLNLHHGKNPESHSARKDNDATVIPMDQNVHLNFIEANPKEEKALQRVFSCFGAFRYWAYKNGRAGTGEDALAFQLWVLEKMEEEQ